MRCDDYRAARLAGADTEEMAEHIAACADCRSLTPLLDDAGRALQDPAQWEDPPGDLEARIVADITAIAGTQRPAPAPSTPSRIRWAWLGAAAIVVALAVAGGLRLRSAPDWTIEVAGTELAPSAVAIVDGWNTDAGTKMRVRTTGLDPAPDGFVYEMWLSKDEIHISGGTFTQPNDVELLIGVTRADYPRIWITLEAIDEDESPSPATVLDTVREG